MAIGKEESFIYNTTGQQPIIDISPNTKASILIKASDTANYTLWVKNSNQPGFDFVKSESVLNKRGDTTQIAEGVVAFYLDIANLGGGNVNLMYKVSSG